jgi:orotidine-5'-phosphate decarboxylase
MEKTVRYIGDEHFKIAMPKEVILEIHQINMQKRFFETLPFDSITVAPYMGEDSVKPFLQYEG